MNRHRSPSPEVKSSPVEDVPSPKEESSLEVPPEPSKLPMSPSIEYLDDDDDEDEDEYDDEFNEQQLPSNMPTRPPPTSISTIRLVQEGRVR
jgi:hypothetical protein